MRRFALFVTVGLALMGACASTEFKSTWKDPAASRVQLQGKRVATFAVTRDEAMRRAAEDAMAREIAKRGVIGVPGYSLPGGDQTRDKDQLRKQLRDANIDGVVVMRVVDRRQEVNYVPGGPGYGSFYGYWDYGWSSVGAPGYLNTDTILSVETLVYSVGSDERLGVPADKLLWGGVSETFDPGKLDSTIKEIIDQAAKEMQKAGLIQKK
jgi:hypothetical protein